MTIESTLNAVGFSDAARNYKQHAVVVGLRSDENEGAPAKRNLGIQFITNDNPVTPEDLPLVPAVTIDEQSTKYEVVEEGHYKIALDNPVGWWGRSIGGCNLWYYQGSEHHTETPPFTLPHYPFQKELRNSEVEGRYSPNKAKYLDFRQDFSAVHPKPLLNQFDLSSKLIQVTRYNYEPILMGNDFRQFGILYIEFRNEMDQPVVNPLFEGIETPSRFGHYLLFDTTRSRAHIDTDLRAQTRKIHPEIVFSISDYEGAPYRRMQLTLPLGWKYNRPQFYVESYGLNEGQNQEDGAPSNDGTMRLYQEEIVLFNGAQGVSGVQLGSDGLSTEYSQDPPVPFPFPAQYLYPTTANALTVPWTPTDFETTKKFTVDVTVPTTAYMFDADRPWQVFAKLGVTPEAGDVGLSSAVWIIAGEEGEPDVELPAYFIRYVAGTMPPEDGGGIPIGPGGPEATQTTSVFKCPEGMEYLERELLKNSVAVADGVGVIEMRIAPPPVDGFGYSPYVGIKPVEAKLRLTFERPDIDDRFEFFTGDPNELRNAMALTPGMPPGMIAPEGLQFLSYEKVDEGTPDYTLKITSNLAINWNKFYTPIGVLLGKSLVEEILEYLGNEDYYKDIGFSFRGNWQPVPEEHLLSYLRPDGSILLPLVFANLNIQWDEVIDDCLFGILIEETNPLGPGQVIKDISTSVKIDMAVIGDAIQNMNVALPLVIGNVLQGRSPVDIKVEALILDVADPHATGRTTLLTVEPGTGDIFGTTFKGLDFEMVYDAQADTITVTKMGGPYGLISISASTADTPYAPLTVPEGVVMKTVNGLDWDDSDEATTSHPLTKYIIPLPFNEEGDIYLPGIDVDHTVEVLPTTFREALATAGLTYSVADSVANNVTVTPNGVNGITADVSVQVDIAAPYVAKDILMNAGYDVGNSNTYFHRREFVMVKVTTKAVIDNWQALRDGSLVSTPANTPYAEVRYISDASRWQQVHVVMLADCRVEMEGEVECLYVPIPIYRTLATGQHEYTARLDFPPVGFQSYGSVTVKMQPTFVEPVGLTTVTKELEATTPNIAALWSQAYEVGCYGIYNDPMQVDQFTSTAPFTGMNESTSWHSTPIIGVSGSADTVQAVGFNDSGALGVRLVPKGGLNRPTTGILIIALAGATLPPEFVTEVGAFKFVQVENAVLILAKFEVLTLPRTVYPFAQNLIEYTDGFDTNSVNVRQTVALDKTLLPAPIQAANGNIRVESTFRMSYGDGSGSFYHNFSSATTARIIASGLKSSFPATADEFYVKSKAEIVVLYEAVHAYESEWGPVPPQP